MEGLFVSYAATVSPNLALPYPPIELPPASYAPGDQAAILVRFDQGMGGWTNKLQEYLNGPARLKAITIEYGKSDEYEWIRRGADYVSSLMQKLGIPNQLIRHEGGHDSTLGQRLETAMLPDISRSLRHLP